MEKRNPNSNPNSSRPSPDGKDWVKYSGIAFEIVAFNLIVIWGGYQLDRYVGNRIPWFIIGALILAVTGTMYFIFKRLNQ